MNKETFINNFVTTFLATRSATVFEQEEYVNTDTFDFYVEQAYDFANAAYNRLTEYNKSVAWMKSDDY